MPSIPGAEKPATQQAQTRGDRLALEQRYGAIGISAVAAAMRFRDDPAPASDEHDHPRRSRAA